MDFKKILSYVGCLIFVLIFFAIAAVAIGFNRGEQGDYQGRTNTGLCGSTPEPYKTIFKAAGEKWVVQPAFIAAIFLGGEHHRTKNSDGTWVTEFDPNTSWPNPDGPWASSPAGASGPFQFMPGTWASQSEYARPNPEHPSGTPEIQDLWDSAFAAAHLNAMNGAAGNTTDLDDLRDAASRYNSGRPWSSGQNIPETASYVPRVIGAFQYFQCVTVATGQWIWPVEGRITSSFGEIGPSHPKPHTGLDIAAPAGTLIKAADSGRVTTVNLNPGDQCGVYVKLEHGSGLESIYCHMIENSPTVTVGQQVSQGQTIGQVDSTGHSTGHHLHLGAKLNGTFVDPMNYLPPK